MAVAVRLSSLSAPLRGALWMTASAFFFAVTSILVRALDDYHPLETVALRNVAGLLVLLPWIVGRRAPVLRTHRLRLHLLRAVLSLGATILWFTTLTVLPLTEATALSFLSPVFIALLALAFLSERMNAERWLAALGAFAGALVILRPGVAAFQPAALLGIATAFVWATSTVIAKLLSRTEPSTVIVLYMMAMVTPMSLILAIPVWRTPDTLELLGFFALGAAGSLGHITMTRALAVADAGLVSPFDYLRLPFVAILAFLIFGERGDPWTWLGAVIIVLCSMSLVRSRSG